MAVALMAYVEDNAVPLRVKYPVKSHGKLHRPQIGSQVASPPGGKLHQTPPKGGTEGLRLSVGNEMQIFRDRKQGRMPPFIYKASPFMGKLSAARPQAVC
jgi:hypothetical protein